ncbi:FAS1-like dehydratase domain-containing protein [Halosegnis rubeus]|jgi:acyl dehydratase|uniref:FAS1-like dehydratase domain-containing protein n=1 Tax=Halosegnis rubeus TaxID=2212850 RepID=UPI0018D61D19|nr:MaoC family dehydratase N-terminal domain-containing protein [Halosegnis rubeus]
MPSRPLAELKAQVGDTHRTATDLGIERGKVAEFARAIHDPADIYLDEAAAKQAGYEAIPAPPTFTRTAEFPRYVPDGEAFNLGFDPARVIHGEQAYEYERPLYVGDTLTGDTTLTDVYQREGEGGGTMTFAVLETAFTDEAGELVLTATGTSIETGQAISEGDE